MKDGWWSYTTQRKKKESRLWINQLPIIHQTAAKNRLNIFFNWLFLQQVLPALAEWSKKKIERKCALLNLVLRP